MALICEFARARGHRSQEIVVVSSPSCVVRLHRNGYEIARVYPWTLIALSGRVPPAPVEKADQSEKKAGDRQVRTSCMKMCAPSKKQQDDDGMKPAEALCAVCSGGRGTVSMMHELARAQPPVSCLVLSGSGRVADLWQQVWPRRQSADFASDAAFQKLSDFFQKKLNESFGIRASAEEVQKLEFVLQHGDIVLFAIGSCAEQNLTFSLRTCSSCFV